MDKGFVHVTETMLVAVGWLLVLSVAWQESALHHARETGQLSLEKMEETLFNVSDALVLEHNTNPWLGCAFFSGEKNRVLSYRVEEKCLSRLKEETPPPKITYVAIVEKQKTTSYFSLEEKEKNCTGIRRPMILHEKNILAWLEVRACE